MKNVKIRCDISACFVISLKEDQSILNKLESKFIYYRGFKNEEK